MIAYHFVLEVEELVLLTFWAEIKNIGAILQLSAIEPVLKRVLEMKGLVPRKDIDRNCCGGSFIQQLVPRLLKLLSFGLSSGHQCSVLLHQKIHSSCTLLLKCGNGERGDEGQFPAWTSRWTAGNELLCLLLPVWTPSRVCWCGLCAAWEYRCRPCRERPVVVFLVALRRSYDELMSSM